MGSTTHNEQTPLARQGDLAVQELPDEVLVYDLKKHKAHCLNVTAAFVWRHCDGLTTVSQMARLLKQEVGSPVDEEVVWYALDKLSKANLLEGQVDVPVKDGLTRRRMIRRLGAIVAVPTVVSLVAPMAVSAATLFVADRKIAQGTCNSPPGPLPEAACQGGDVCCTAGGGGDRLCIQVNSSPLTFACLGQACRFEDDAGDCN